MKKFAAIFVLFGMILFGGEAVAQTCDFGVSQTSPTYNWYDNNGNAYTTFTPGSQNWEIYTSAIANPVGSPKVLHTNPGNGNGSQSPQWLTSQAFSGFDFNYHQLQWSFWFGRGQGVGQNGGNNDGSIVWLYVNKQTGLNLLSTPGLEGIKVTWHHNNNKDNIRLSEVHGGTEYVIGDFVLIDNLNLYEWGTTVKVQRIPGGYPTGTDVTYKLWMSSPSPDSTNFGQYSVPAESDPIAASTFLRIDTTITNAWVPTSSQQYMAIHSFYAGSRKDAAEYNQLCWEEQQSTPVELTSFTAEYRHDIVDLNWQTATETNNYGFEIQRSIEHDGTWETIGFVEGQGTSDSPTKYSYTDAPNADGASTIAYRLKQVDRDGSYEYSNTILVSVAPSSADVLYNFPNPFNPATNITFNLLTDDVVSLKVYNAAGKMVAELHDQTEMKAGYHTASFNGNGLPSGQYFYRLTTSAGTKTNQMVLSK